MPITELTSRSINGGLVTALPACNIGVAESPDSQNLDPTDILGATTRAGSALFGVTGPVAASGTPGKGLFPWTRNAGTTYIFAANATSIYSVDTGSWFVVANGIATDSIAQFTPLNNMLVAVASGIAPKISTAGSTLYNLGGTPPALAKYCTTYVQKVFLAGDTVNPNRIDWSASNNAEDYTTANNAGHATIGDGDGDIINGLSSTKRVLYIFKRHNVYALTGDSPFNFEASRLRAIGLVSEYGFATTGEGTFFASDDGIYYIQGLDCSRISDPIQPTYKAIADKTTIALEIKGDKLFVFYKNAATQNDSAFVLAYMRKMPDGGVRGIWAQYNAQTYSVAKTAKDNTLYGITSASSLQLYQLDTGTAATITAYWNTPDCDFGDQYAMKTLVRYYFLVRPPTATTTFTVQFYADGTAVGGGNTILVGTTGSYQIINASPPSTTTITGRTIRAKLSWSGVQTVFGWRMYADIRVEADFPRR